MPRGRPNSRNNTMSAQRSDRRDKLARTAQETLSRLPEILEQIPDFDAAQSELLSLPTLQPLKAEDCPGYTSSDDPEQKGTRIRVINCDTFDLAIALSEEASTSTSKAPELSPSPVVVLNLASDCTPGGGWLRGSTAQEECLCYRSSLFLSLHKRYYRLGSRSGIYSPNVVIIRDSMKEGHNLLPPAVDVPDLPRVSVISIAAIRRPQTKSVVVGGKNVPVYANPEDRDLMKDKMRLCLRIAAGKGHRKLVLGALGCGAFHNPTGVVAMAWKEVLQESEFAGGWWDQIAFAVLDNGRQGNFEPFKEKLGSLLV